jgi:hypothetical protein
VETVLSYLPDVIEFLETEVVAKKSGRKLDGRRLICAAVAGEAYRRLHARFEPSSEVLQKACEAYWRACGNKQTGSGEPVNWLRYLKRHRDADDPWVRSILEKFEASTEYPLK